MIPSRRIDHLFRGKTMNKWSIRLDCAHFCWNANIGFADAISRESPRKERKADLRWKGRAMEWALLSRLRGKSDMKSARTRFSLKPFLTKCVQWIFYSRRCRGEHCSPSKPPLSKGRWLSECETGGDVLEIHEFGCFSVQSPQSFAFDKIQPTALVAITDCSPLRLQTCHRHVCLTRRAPY